jgi:hypothetical protein
MDGVAQSVASLNILATTSLRLSCLPTDRSLYLQATHHQESEGFPSPLRRPSISVLANSTKQRTRIAWLPAE